MIKPLPDPKTYPIVPPDMDYCYFDEAETSPFEAHNQSFSLVNASWLADCALLVYAHPGFARLAFKLAGFEHFHFFKGTGTECMAAWNECCLLISFRGTELKSLSMLYEMSTNLQAIPSSFSQGGKVHTGFSKALDEIWGGSEGLHRFIQQRIAENPDRAIWMTGHSLGGALASLCFAKVKQATGLYIFGAPRVGNQAFTDLLKGRPVWRVEHAKDPIPMLPPNLPALHFCYHDLGELIYIQADQQLRFQRPEKTAEEYKQLIWDTIKTQESRRKALSMKLPDINQHVRESVQQWLDNIKQLQGDKAISIRDHMPIFYCVKLWNLRAAQTEGVVDLTENERLGQ